MSESKPPALRRRRRWDPAGVAAVVLAIAVGVGWAASVIIASLGTPVDERAADLLTGIGQMLVEAVVIYLSFRVGQEYPTREIVP